MGAEPPRVAPAPTPAAGVRDEAALARHATGPERGDAELKLIIAYKLVKSVLELAAGVALLVATAGVAGELSALAEGLRAHATASWSLALADRLASAATGRNLTVVALASLFDGALSFVEGWALHRRSWWGPWLVVAATGSLVPFEVVALARRLTAGRLVLLLVNGAIVWVLVRRRVEAARRVR